MNDSTTPSSRKRATTAGVVAGLVAGGAIGLVAAVPSWTSAASDEAAVVALQEDTGTDAPDDAPIDAPDAPDERADRGARLRETLQPLVDDETITSEQADAVTEHLVENMPDRGDRPGRLGRPGLDGHGPNHAVLADLLQMDRETMVAELRDGKSIADIADENGIDVQTVIDGLVADAESHLDLAVDHGLSEEQAAERLERITERITEGVNRTRPADG